MYGTFTLTGRHTTPSGKAHAGQVVITPNATIRDVDGDVVMSGAERVSLDETGAWSIVLPCDSPGLNPSEGLGYRVGYALHSVSTQPQSFYATADLAGSTLDVSDIVTVSVPSPLSAIVGPQGEPGPVGPAGAPGPKGDPGESVGPQIGYDASGSPYLVGDPAADDTTQPTSKRLVTQATADIDYARDVPAIQSTLAKLAAGEQDVNILMLGDSIDAGQPLWFWRLGQWLSTQWPAHTVKYRDWNSTSDAWGSWSTVQTGTGLRTLWLSNGSVGGRNTSYPLGPRMKTMVYAVAPDLTLIGYCANEGQDTESRAPLFRTRFLGLTESILLGASTQIVGVGKPPKPATPGAIAYRLDQMRQACRIKGFGYMDFYQRFKDTPNYQTTLIGADQIHPTTAGQDVMFAEACRYFTYRRASMMALAAQGESSLVSPVRNLLTNGDFSSWSGAVPTGWSATNVTMSKNTTLFETGTYAADLSPTDPATAVSYIVQNVDVSKLNGEWLTLTSRVRINPAAASPNILTLGTTQLLDGFTSMADDGHSWASDGFFWQAVTIRIGDGASNLQVIVYLRTVGTGPDTVTFDRLILSRGLLPRDMN